jgi:hypothetical protein
VKQKGREKSRVQERAVGERGSIYAAGAAGPCASMRSGRALYPIRKDAIWMQRQHVVHYTNY